MTGFNKDLEVAPWLLPEEQQEIERQKREDAAIREWEKLQAAFEFSYPDIDVLFKAAMRAGGEELLKTNGGGHMNAMSSKRILANLSKRATAVQRSVALLTDLLTKEQSALAKVTAHEHAEEHQRRRTERISATQEQRATTAPEMGRKCSKCGKKPARIDDLCKICAREAGLLVRGKIGNPDPGAG